jgi:hypothetical protein
VTFASSPVYIPSKPTAFGHLPQKIQTIKFGKFTVQIPQLHDQSGSLFSASIIRSKIACSSKDQSKSESTCRSNRNDKIQGAPSGNNTNSNMICWNCLGPGHLAHFCSRPLRCKECFNYGHRARWCLTRNKPALLWRPKIAVKLSAKQNLRRKKSADSLPSSYIQENPNPHQSAVQVSPPPQCWLIISLRM